MTARGAAIGVAAGEARSGLAGLRGAIGALQRLRTRSGDPRDADEMLALLRLLHGVGRRDLPLGRLFEGHVDASQIVSRYASAERAGKVEAAIAAGAALGVWNAALPGEPLVLAGGRLSGGKSFASGAGVLSHALVTADTPKGRQLLLLDLGRTAPEIDRGWWRTIGMQRSETHIARWRDAPVAADDLVGAPEDYVREPWFSGGAIRFAAVQAGGVAALFDQARDHLVAAGRAADPHQSGRLAALYALAEGAAAAVRRVAATWFEEEDATRLARVAAARMAVAEAGERALILAEQAVGLQGMFVGHPLAATLADLTVYLRQPAPDAQRMRVGAAAAAGLLVPCL